MKPLYFVPFGSLALMASVAIVEACSSSSSNGAAGGSQDSGAAATDSGPGGSTRATCGPPPYINLGIVVEQASTSDNPARIGGATLTSALCPDASFTSDDDGGIFGLVTEGVPFYGQFAATGFANTLSPEEEFDADTFGNAIALPPSLITAIIPSYDANKPTIFGAIRKDTGTSHDGGADCTDPSGVSVSVVGHPEAVVTYYSATAVPSPMPGAMTTSAGGEISITGLDEAASPVTLAATKTGCTVSFIQKASTGRIPLQNGYISIAAAYLRD